MALDELDNVWVTELLFTVDAATGLIVDAAGDVEACLGLDPGLLVGFPLFGAVHREDLDRANAAFERTKSEGRATWEGRVMHADGSFVEYAWEGRLGTDGQMIYARSRDAARAKATLADLRIYERLADLTTDLFIVVDNRGRIVRANRAAQETHNCSVDEFFGAELASFVPESSHHLLNAIPMQLARGDTLVNFQMPTFDGRGGQITVEGTATFDDVTDRWYVVERDVTERVAREHELEVAQRFFDLSTSLLVLVDADDRILRANAAFLTAVGADLPDTAGRAIVEVLGVASANGLRRTLAEVRSGQVSQGHEVDVTLEDQSQILAIQFAPAREGGAVYLSCRDITEERSLQRELVRRASTDSLTGLANRATLVEAIQADLATGRPTAFVMLDLDDFKRINDSLGHAAGDDLLVRIAERLDACTRGVDIVARLGGDEFAVLLRGVPDGPTALLVAEKLRAAFHHPFDVLDRPVHITASVGAAIGRGSTHTVEQLLLEADLAAYAAKQAGADRARVFDDVLRATTDFAHALEGHLRRVLDAADFDIDVVPVKDLGGSVVGVGVTAPAISISGERRWNAQSMEVAKRLGLLGPLSLRLARESIGGLSSWLIAHPDAHLDIVFDVVELEVAGFARQLLDLLEEFDVATNQLIVSLTGVPDVGMQAVDLHAIDELRRADVRVSFGASRADTNTLAALHLGCIDRIDVDATRVALAPEGSIERLIAATVFDVADRLGVEVVVDASFTPDVVDTVSMFPNCAPVGLVFGRPVPLDEFVNGVEHSVSQSPTDL